MFGQPNQDANVKRLIPILKVWGPSVRGPCTKRSSHHGEDAQDELTEVDVPCQQGFDKSVDQKEPRGEGVARARSIG